MNSLEIFISKQKVTENISRGVEVTFNVRASRELKIVFELEERKRVQEISYLVMTFSEKAKN